MNCQINLQKNKKVKHEKKRKAREKSQRLMSKLMKLFTDDGILVLHTYMNVYIHIFSQICYAKKKNVHMYRRRTPSHTHTQTHTEHSYPSSS